MPCARNVHAAARTLKEKAHILLVTKIVCQQRPHLRPVIDSFFLHYIQNVRFLRAKEEIGCLTYLLLFKSVPGIFQELKNCWMQIVEKSYREVRTWKKDTFFSCGETLGETTPAVKPTSHPSLSGSLPAERPNETCNCFKLGKIANILY